MTRLITISGRELCKILEKLGFYKQKSATLVKYYSGSLLMVIGGFTLYYKMWFFGIILFIIGGILIWKSGYSS